MNTKLTRYAVLDTATGKIWDATARRFMAPSDGGRSHASQAAAMRAAHRASNLCMNIGDIEIVKYEV